MGGRTRDFGLELLSRAGVSVGADDATSIHIHDERFWDRVISQRQLGFGEAYMDGWWDCERLDEMLTRILESGVVSDIRPGVKIAAMATRSWAMNRQTQRRAARNARHHYDIGNDLYERMLDPRMVYSCAYWSDADDLASAQEAKLDLICRKLHLEPGMRILDIGCGWGGLLEFAARTYGVTGVGISPAGNQVTVARERCRDLPVTIEQSDYRHVRGTFDRIVSVGMMEHVGPRNLPQFFQVCDQRLESGGMMLHHTIGSTVSKHHTDPFFERYIFPGGVVPSLAQISRSAESTWTIEDVHNFGPDYDRTLMAWAANVEAAWAELPAYDDRFRRMWRYYLLSSAAGFRSRNLQLWQVVMRRTGRAPRYEAVR